MLPLALANAQSENAFVELFDGTLDNWRIAFTDSGNIRVADGVLRVEGPNGWIRSRMRYGDLRAEIEFRFLTEDADSGIFLRADPDRTFARGWPDGGRRRIRADSPARLLPTGAVTVAGPRREGR
jgi:hypothetical protein